MKFQKSNKDLLKKNVFELVDTSFGSLIWFVARVW